MRGVYTANISISAESAAETLILITAPSAAVVEIIGANVSNSDTASGEQINIGLYHVTTFGSAAGSAITCEKHEKSDASSGSTVIGNLSVEPTTYSSNPIDRQGVSILAGYRYDPLPEERPIIPPSASMGLRMMVSPSPSSFNCIAQIVFREIG